MSAKRSRAALLCAALSALPSAEAFVSPSRRPLAVGRTSVGAGERSRCADREPIGWRCGGSSRRTASRDGGRRVALRFFPRGNGDDGGGEGSSTTEEKEQSNSSNNNNPLNLNIDLDGIGRTLSSIDLEGDSSFKKYGRPRDINESSFGPLLPLAEAVDEATGGWGLSYADLHPATPRTTVGQAFLATNFFYAAAGLWLGLNGDWFYGGLTELAGIVSFVYHYTQLEFGKNRSEVRLALLIDYFCAGSALITGGVYMLQAGITAVPVAALVSAALAAICLSLCWVWEFGYPYIFWHSLWHILSAYTGWLVGQDHLTKIAG